MPIAATLLCRLPDAACHPHEANSIIHSLSGRPLAGPHLGPVHMLIDHHMVAPLDRSLKACIEAVKATKPEDGHEKEIRAALLYQHALRFDAPVKERQSILLEAFMAGLPGLEKQVEQIADEGELVTYRRKGRGRKIVGRVFRRRESVVKA